MVRTLRIERLAPDGTALVLPLLQAQFAEHAIPLSPGEVEEALRGLVVGRDRGTVLVARGPAPVGIAVLAWTWTLEHGGRVGWLEELYVAPPFRNRGIGARLLAAALEAAREEGCRAVDLEVATEHGRAERLYERAGFRRLDRARFVKLLPAP